MQQTVGEITLTYDEHGPADGPPVLLVAGLGMQMIGWRDGFIDQLADRGLRVFRFDNRDSGLSTHLSDRPVPDIGALMAGDTSSASYTLSDMASDTAGFIDALGIAPAHVVGVSMGGMIAQQLAIEHPDKVATLTSIMSTTGDRTVGAATPEATAALLMPVPLDREKAIDKLTHDSRVIGSPGFRFDEEAVRERHAASLDRSSDAVGTARQLAAIMASPDRTPQLRELDVPTLVIHGEADPLIGVSGGRATAEAIPSARLRVIDGMGHDLPEELWGEIADEIVGLVTSSR